MQEMTLAIAGIDFANTDGSNRRSEAMMTLPGEPITLRPEPRNKHDANAIAIVSPRGVQLGYVSAERAPYIGARLRRGEAVAAGFQGFAGSAALVRIRFGGGLPTMPALRDPPSGQPDSTNPDDADAFYPDEEGSEWGAA